MFFPDAIISDFVKQETFCEGLVDLLVAWAALQWSVKWAAPQAGGTGQHQPPESSVKTNVQPCTGAGVTPCTSAGWGRTSPGQFRGRGHVGAGRPRRAWASTVSRSRWMLDIYWATGAGDDSPPRVYEAAAGVLHLDLGSTIQRGRSKLERDQWRAARFGGGGLEQVICEETLGLLSFRRRRLWEEPPEVGRSISEIEPGSSQERVLKSAWQVATRETLTAYGSGWELEHIGFPP